MVAPRHVNLKKPMILFFINGSVPTPNDYAEAAKLGAVSFRNARFVDKSDPIEANDGVAGAVPDNYQNCPIAKPIVEYKPIPQPFAQTPVVETDVKPKRANRATKPQGW